MLLTYIKNKNGPRIEPCGARQDIEAGWEKIFAKLTRNDLLEIETNF